MLVIGSCSGAPLPAPDGGGDAAVDRGDGGDTCAALASRYVTTAAGLRSCSVAADCWSYAADCAIETYAGTPTCYLILNLYSDRTQFADMSLEWRQLGCPMESACGSCVDTPVLDCQDGSCVATQ